MADSLSSPTSPELPRQEAVETDMVASALRRIGEIRDTAARTLEDESRRGGSGEAESGRGQTWEEDGIGEDALAGSLLVDEGLSAELPPRRARGPEIIVLSPLTSPSPDPERHLTFASLLDLELPHTRLPSSTPPLSYPPITPPNASNGAANLHRAHALERFLDRRLTSGLLAEPPRELVDWRIAERRSNAELQVEMNALLEASEGGRGGDWDWVGDGGAGMGAWEPLGEVEGQGVEEDEPEALFITSLRAGSNSRRRRLPRPPLPLLPRETSSGVDRDLSPPPPAAAPPTRSGVILEWPRELWEAAVPAPPHPRDSSDEYHPDSWHRELDGEFIPREEVVRAREEERLNRYETVEERMLAIEGELPDGRTLEGTGEEWTTLWRNNPVDIERRGASDRVGRGGRTTLFESSDEVEWRRRSQAPAPSYRPRSPSRRPSFSPTPPPPPPEPIQRSLATAYLDALRYSSMVPRRNPASGTAGARRERMEIELEEDEGEDGLDWGSPLRFGTNPSSFVATARAGRDPRTRDETNALMGQTLRMKKDCWLLYCGRREEKLPAGFEWSGEGQGGGGGAGGCGALVCARGLVEVPKRTFVEDVGEERAVSSDLPPASGRVGDVREGSEDVGDRGVLGCKGCRTKDVGCRACGNVLGFRVIRPCAPCSATRAVATDGLLWHYRGSSITLVPRLNGFLPSPSFEASDSDSETDSRNSLASGLNPSSGRLEIVAPAVGSRMKWVNVPHPQSDFEEGLVGEPSEWLSEDTDAWWVENVVARHCRRREGLLSREAFVPQGLPARDRVLRPSGAPPTDRQAAPGDTVTSHLPFTVIPAAAEAAPAAPVQRSRALSRTHALRIPPILPSVRGPAVDAAAVPRPASYARDYAPGHSSHAWRYSHALPSYSGAATRPVGGSGSPERRVRARLADGDAGTDLRRSLTAAGYGSAFVEAGVSSASSEGGGARRARRRTTVGVGRVGR